MEKKNDWVSSVVLAVIFAVVILLIFSFYCKSSCSDKLLIEEIAEKCEERGLRFSHYEVYPDSDIKVVCKSLSGFQEIKWQETP